MHTHTQPIHCTCQEYSTFPAGSNIAAGLTAGTAASLLSLGVLRARQQLTHDLSSVVGARLSVVTPLVAAALVGFDYTRSFVSSRSAQAAVQSLNPDEQTLRIKWTATFLRVARRLKITDSNFCNGIEQMELCPNA